MYWLADLIFIDSATILSNGIPIISNDICYSNISILGIPDIIYKRYDCNTKNPYYVLSCKLPNKHYTLVYIFADGPATVYKIYSANWYIKINTDYNKKITRITINDSYYKRKIYKNGGYDCFDTIHNITDKLTGVNITVNYNTVCPSTINRDNFQYYLAVNHIFVKVDQIAYKIRRNDFIPSKLSLLPKLNINNCQYYMNDFNEIVDAYSIYEAHNCMINASIELYTFDNLHDCDLSYHSIPINWSEFKPSCISVTSKTSDKQDPDITIKNRYCNLM